MICKNCNTPLIEKTTKRTPEQLKKQYYFTAYYSCPNCGRMYHDEKFKVINENVDLFANGSHSPAGFGTADVNVWTDGACRDNGTDKARAAWAFVSGSHENAGVVEGKQTNNTAEAYAVYHALLWAVEEKKQRVRVHTDSQITIQSLLKPYQKVKANQEIFKKIADVIAENNLQVAYEKVPGHADDVNNNRADKLANSLAGIS